MTVVGGGGGGGGGGEAGVSCASSWAVVLSPVRMVHVCAVDVYL